MLPKRIRNCRHQHGLRNRNVLRGFVRSHNASYRCRRRRCRRRRLSIDIVIVAIVAISIIIIIVSGIDGAIVVNSVVDIGHRVGWRAQRTRCLFCAFMRMDIRGIMVKC